MSKMKRDPKTGRIFYPEPGEMASKPISVKFSKAADTVLREMDNTSGYIRAAVEAKLKADGLLD